MEKEQIDFIRREQISDDKEIKKENRTFLKRFFKLITSKIFLLQGIKFAIVGAIGTFVNLTILYLLTDIFGILYLVSETIAFVISLLNNYVLNKIETFKENIQEKPLRKGIQFSFISSLALIVNLSVLFILVEFFDIFYLFAEFFAICCAFVINFSGNRFWTFRNKEVVKNKDITINNRFVELIMSLWLITLGFTDLIFGLIDSDYIFVLLGIPLLFIGLFIFMRFLYFKNQ